MCRVAGVTGITDKNRKKIWEIIEELGVRMTPGNRDGLGYAAFDKKGNIFGEKWIYNYKAFQDRSNKIATIGANRVDRAYTFFGDLKINEARGIILHTRAATSGSISIKNTHPFIEPLEKPDFALIHNGGISNHSQLIKKHSTCDSEVILHEYIYSEVNKDLKKMNDVFNTLRGWYTCLILAKDKDGQPIMDILTNTGMLHSVFIPELNCRIYTTNKYDLIDTCDFFDLKYEGLFKFKDNCYRRLNIDTNEIIEKGYLKKEEINYDDIDINGDYTQNFYDHIMGKWE